MINLGFFDQARKGWNAFRNRDPTNVRYSTSYSSISSTNPARKRLSYGVDRTILSSLINRIAVDASQIEIYHAQLDDEGRFKDIVDSGLNTCLNVSANKDQSGRAFRQDMFQSMLDEGVVAVAPIDTDTDLDAGGSYRIESMRVAKIVEWRPDHVVLNCYDDNSGEFKDIIFQKSQVAIIENPFYSIMNEPNSTWQRLRRKMALLDVADEKTASGKLDIIIQLPYSTNQENKKKRAEDRIRDIEMQLVDSKYGIAYADATEKITQLNRPIENNLQKQVEYLTEQAFSQIGMTMEILNGTADESTMQNYYTRIVEPIVAVTVEELKRTFLSQTARTQGKSICYFRDPFKLVPVGAMAEISDKFTRNEIMTSNEIRQKIGMRPSSDPRADMLLNSNLNHTDEELGNKGSDNNKEEKEDESQNA